jgi:hypothetical protein
MASARRTIMAAFDPATLDRWRALAIVDRDGTTVGTISEFYLDRETGHPTWALVETGLFGATQTFVPLVHAAELTDGLQVPYEKRHIKNSPRVDPHDELTPDDEARLFAHYGVDYEPLATEEAEGPDDPSIAEGPGPVPVDAGTAEEVEAVPEGSGTAAEPELVPTEPGTADGPAPAPEGPEDSGLIPEEPGTTEGPETSPRDPTAAEDPAVDVASVEGSSTDSTSMEDPGADLTSTEDPGADLTSMEDPGADPDQPEGSGTALGEPASADTPESAWMAAGTSPTAAGSAPMAPGPSPVAAGSASTTPGPASMAAEPDPMASAEEPGTVSGEPGTAEGPGRLAPEAGSSDPDATLIAPDGFGPAPHHPEDSPDPDLSRTAPVDPGLPGSTAASPGPVPTTVDKDGSDPYGPFAEEPSRDQDEPHWVPAGSFDEPDRAERPTGASDRWREAKLAAERERVARADAQPEERSPLERARRRLERLVGVGQDHSDDDLSPTDREEAERARRARLGFDEDDPQIR